MLSLVRNLEVPLHEAGKKLLSYVDLVIDLVQRFFLPNEEKNKVTLNNFPSPSAGGLLNYIPQSNFVPSIFPH